MEFSHIDEKGKAEMVDVSGKDVTLREASAAGFIRIDPEVIKKIEDKKMPKGDVLSVARVAGIMAAKRTGEMIPMCHPIGLDHVQIDFEIKENGIKIKATARVNAKTGIEMEAMAAVGVAALTIYDMCKSADRAMTIERIYLVEKSGGRSGHYVREMPDQVATIVGVSIGEEKSKSKQNVGKAKLIEDHGLEGDIHAGTPNQQVSMIAFEVYKRIQSIKGYEAEIGEFAENITTEGVDLTELPVGTILKIGDAELKIMRIGKPYGTGFQLDPRIGDPPLISEGVFANVIKGGEIKVGDEIEIYEN